VRERANASPTSSTRTSSSDGRPDRSTWPDRSDSSKPPMPSSGRHVRAVIAGFQRHDAPPSQGPSVTRGYSVGGTTQQALSRTASRSPEVASAPLWAKGVSIDVRKAEWPISRASCACRDRKPFLW
jgi:hypothetical protein